MPGLSCEDEIYYLHRQCSFVQETGKIEKWSHIPRSRTNPLRFGIQLNARKIGNIVLGNTISPIKSDRHASPIRTPFTKRFPKIPQEEKRLRITRPLVPSAPRIHLPHLTKPMRISFQIKRKHDN